MDYGQGKTSERETYDSVRMLGIVLVCDVVVVITVVALVLWRMLT